MTAFSGPIILFEKEKKIETPLEDVLLLLFYFSIRFLPFVVYLVFNCFSYYRKIQLDFLFLILPALKLSSDSL